MVTILSERKNTCVCLQLENASEESTKVTQYCSDHGIKPWLVLQIELLNDVFSTDSSYFELQLLG